MIVENGMVLGAEAAWDARELRTELRKTAIDDSSREIRSTMRIGDVLEAIHEAPVQLQEHLFDCWKDGEIADIGATVNDMVDYYIDQLAIGEVDGRG